MKLACARLINPSVPQTNTYRVMAQSGFQAHAPRSNDPSLSQNGADPFVGGPILNNSFFRNMTSQNTTNSEDITMKSRSTSSSHDVAMSDISRMPSPIADHRRRSIPESEASVYALRLKTTGTEEQNRHLQKEIQGEREVNRYDSHFDDGMAALSPSRKQSNLSGISAPSNTRASSAANTPPESGAALVESHPRSVSVTTSDPPTPTFHVSSDMISARLETLEKGSRLREIYGNAKERTETTIKKRPVGRPKGRKEGRSSEQGLDVPVNNTDRRASTGSTNANAKERAYESDEKVGDGKRRRMNSTVGSKMPLEDRAENSHLLSPTRKVSKTGLQDDISAKLGEMDELTADGVAVRHPLGELDNIM